MDCPKPALGSAYRLKAPKLRENNTCRPIRETLTLPQSDVVSNLTIRNCTKYLRCVKFHHSRIQKIHWLIFRSGSAFCTLLRWELVWDSPHYPRDTRWVLTRQNIAIPKPKPPAGPDETMTLALRSPVPRHHSEHMHTPTSPQSAWTSRNHCQHQQRKRNGDTDNANNRNQGPAWSSIHDRLMLRPRPLSGNNRLPKRHGLGVAKVQLSHQHNWEAMVTRVIELTPRPSNSPPLPPALISKSSKGS